MRRADPRVGFTLLEVMAAVAVLGVLYVTLAGVAIQGLQNQGESRRRLEASLLADEYMIELEAQFDGTPLPEIEREETDERGYLITVEPPKPLPRSALEAAGANEASPVIFPGADEDSGLYEISVVVSWQEAGRERRVQRTTYAFDAEAVASAAVAKIESGDAGS